jgi:hypothetical protein
MTKTSGSGSIASVPYCPAEVEIERLADLPTDVLQARAQRGCLFLPFGVTLVTRHQHADAAHPIRLLRARGERPRKSRTANERDEFAPSHRPSPRPTQLRLAHGKRPLGEFRCESPGALNVGFHRITTAVLR